MNCDTKSYTHIMDDGVVHRRHAIFKQIQFFTHEFKKKKRTQIMDKRSSAID